MLLVTCALISGHIRTAATSHWVSGGQSRPHADPYLHMQQYANNNSLLLKLEAHGLIVCHGNGVFD